YIPQNLYQWLGAQAGAGDQAASGACAMAEQELAAGISFMNSRGLLHLDAHFGNILTDGQRLYFTDYGLAMSSGFELSRDEVGFFARHQTYDRCYTAAYLVHWLVTALHGAEDRDDRDALVRACAAGKYPAGLPEYVAAILTRHAPVAAVMSGFIREFAHQSRESPCPLEEIRQLDGMYSSSAC
ncbi:MAG TPA: protein kinase family protein, partial [Streptosporangiaceae bacterium]|nr:protein kinase family protein [Streptosporangiaceae bacterium]